ncbi:mucin-5AC isoform X2 [Entelurus aequoreus]|uniref:mucin-5AC isoform X2 n=1 Tax=Entelurus aequoreus TaxID=161455 RepID=UPI002B1E0114|nr:mucin-5AC isoform X2 [Entelurus aequoreus]
MEHCGGLSWRPAIAKCGVKATVQLFNQARNRGNLRVWGMKPDGVTMDTTEPVEAVAVVEPSVSQDQAVERDATPPERAESDGAAEAATETIGNTKGAEPEVKPQAVASKMQAATKASSGSRSQPSTVSLHRNVNNHLSTKTTSGEKAAVKLSVAGAVPKKAVGVAAVAATVRPTTRVASKRPTGAATLSRPTSSAAVATGTNGSKHTTLNGSNGKPAAGIDKAARTKSSVTVGRSAAFLGPKASTSTAAKPEGGAIPKTNRPASAPSTSRSAPSASRLGSSVAGRSHNTATSAPSASRTASSTSRAANNVASRPPSSASARTAASKVATVPSSGRTAATHSTAAAAMKDPGRPPSSAVAKKPAASASAVAKKTELSKPTATGKPTSTSKLAPKKADPKVPQTKPGPTKISSGPAPKFQAASKPLGRTPPSSPAIKSTTSSTTLTKHGSKPTQAVSPYSAVRKTKPSNCASYGPGQRGTGKVVTHARQQRVSTNVSLGQKPTAVKVPSKASAQDVTVQSHPAASCSPCSLINTDEHQVAQSDARSSPHVELPPPPEVSSEPLDVLAVQKPSSTAAKPVAQTITPNDEEDGEEKEVSQPVSVSEMSGTTQPTEESRPGSAGPMGGSAWRAGGAFLSELDSLSGSQQGASEFSAPGVLEGTESIDDLGDGSLKGASVSSPDFEKVPDIPVNDFEEDDDDDRVCDMDVGSERTDEIQRLRHDNDVDEEDEDVEMASEGVTESGLESYGNADEDDFVDDERLDNLNRLALPPPPPQLPSAPGAQWDRPNPFADPWAEHNRAQQPNQVEADVSPLLEPLQEDSEAASQSPAQAWLEISSDSCITEHPGAAPLTSDKDEGQRCVVAPLQILAPLPASTLSSESGSPAQLIVTSPQPDLMESRDQKVKAQTMPADEVLRGVVTALTSNPSSSSVTEDEASDTEGEALLDDALETQQNLTIEIQPKARFLSTVEESEEFETARLTEDMTPPSATSLASYGFDSATTASNVQSTGESCIKSPGIFSLEELPEESKELPHPTQSSLAEQQYTECNKQAVESSEEAPTPSPARCALQPAGEKADDLHLPCFSAICEKPDTSFTGNV